MKIELLEDYQDVLRQIKNSKEPIIMSELIKNLYGCVKEDRQKYGQFKSKVNNIIRQLKRKDMVTDGKIAKERKSKGVAFGYVLTETGENYFRGNTLLNTPVKQRKPLIMKIKLPQPVIVKPAISEIQSNPPSLEQVQASIGQKRTFAEVESVKQPPLVSQELFLKQAFKQLKTYSVDPAYSQVLNTLYEEGQDIKESRLVINEEQLPEAVNLEWRFPQLKKL